MLPLLALACAMLALSADAQEGEYAPETPVDTRPVRSAAPRSGDGLPPGIEDGVLGTLAENPAPSSGGPLMLLKAGEKTYELFPKNEAVAAELKGLLGKPGIAFVPGKPDGTRLKVADASDVQLVEVPWPELKGDLDPRDAEMIAIQENGRTKPLQTYVHEQMEQLVGRPLFANTPSLKDKYSGRKIPAMEMFLSLWLRPQPLDHAEASYKRIFVDHFRKCVRLPIILIAYGPLKLELGLPRGEKYFSYERIIRSPNFRALRTGASRKRHENKEKEMTELEKELEIVEQRLHIVEQIANANETLPLVPHPADPDVKWQSLGDFYGRTLDEFDELYARPGTLYSSTTAKTLRGKFREFALSYTERDAAKFAGAAREFRAALASLSPSVYPAAADLHREGNYNTTRPFGKAWLFYIATVLLGLAFFKLKSRALFAIPALLFACGLAMHTYGLVMRCMIAGRPPVSNMYESVIWVGFGAAVFGMIFEMIYRKRYFIVSGAGAGFTALAAMELIPAFYGNARMPGFEAGINPLVPVLRDNFWLTVHVLTITLSYAAFALGWVLGHVTLWKHLFSPQNRDEHRQLHQFLYRVMQVGVLLIACGTILGGVWAYYSWGRFWGWDPKETWAFITLMCYLVVLHGRFAGWWGNFGLSIGSVVCFLAVVMAWYGVNFVLGNGLHAYASGAGGEKIVVSILGADLLFTLAAGIRYLTWRPAGGEGGGDSDGGDDGDGKTPSGASPLTLTSGDPIEEVRKIFSDQDGGKSFANEGTATAEPARSESTTQK